MAPNFRRRWVVQRGGGWGWPAHLHNSVCKRHGRRWPWEVASAAAADRRQPINFRAIRSIFAFKSRSSRRAIFKNQGAAERASGRRRRGHSFRPFPAILRRRTFFFGGSIICMARRKQQKKTTKNNKKSKNAERWLMDSVNGRFEQGRGSLATDFYDRFDNKMILHQKHVATATQTVPPTSFNDAVHLFDENHFLFRTSCSSIQFLFPSRQRNEGSKTKARQNPKQI